MPRPSTISSTLAPTTESMAAAQRDRVFADTATFYPISIADLVLRLAEIGIFELVWSDYLLDEIERVLVERKRLPQPAAEYFCDCIRETFPGGRIPRSAYEHLLASRTGPDPADHEHSAAAVAGNVDVILSADRTGFPMRDTSPARRRHPDEYLAELLNLFPTEIAGVLTEMASSRREPSSVHDIIAALKRAGLRRFATGATTLLGE